MRKGGNWPSLHRTWGGLGEDDCKVELKRAIQVANLVSGGFGQSVANADAKIMMGINVVEIRNDCRFDSLPYTDDSVEDLPPLTASTSIDIEYFIE